MVPTRVDAEVMTADDVLYLGVPPVSFERGLLFGSVPEGDAGGVAVRALNATSFLSLSPPVSLSLSSVTEQSDLSRSAGNTLIYDLMTELELGGLIASLRAIASGTGGGIGSAVWRCGFSA